MRRGRVTGHTFGGYVRVDLYSLGRGGHGWESEHIAVYGYLLQGLCDDYPKSLEIERDEVEV